MPFSATYLDRHHVVETVYAGALSPEEFNAAVAATANTAAEHLCTRFLSDCRDLQTGERSTTLDIWALADFLARLPAGTFEREALLLPAAVTALDDIRFYETTCRNRGLDVRIFSARDEALAWLAS